MERTIRLMKSNYQYFSFLKGWYYSVIFLLQFAQILVFHTQLKELYLINTVHAW